MKYVQHKLYHSHHAFNILHSKFSRIFHTEYAKNNEMRNEKKVKMEKCLSFN